MCKHRKNQLVTSLQTRRLIPCAVVLVTLFAAVPNSGEAAAMHSMAAAAQDDLKLMSQRAIEQAIFCAFDAEDFQRAATLLEHYLERSPNNAGMQYNLACAYSQLGRKDKACTALFQAVERGFRDFDHLKRDPDLAAIRDEPMYRAILDAANRVAANDAQSALDRWKQTYGSEGYRFEIDDERKLVFATALDQDAHDAMREMLEQEADQLIGTLFDSPPSYYILIAIPTPADARRILGDDEIGGKYEHAERRLVSRDIGSSLRHEFVHALHYGHMESLGLTEPHPAWIQEGLAALYERYDILPDGSFRFMPNERHNIVWRNARGNRLTPWALLFAMSGDRFMRTANRLYPEARSIFEFLADRDKLSAWYRMLCQTSAEDPTGAIALERVFDKPIAEIESEWRAWVRARPMIDTRIDPGDAALGIVSSPNAANDGVFVEEVLAGSAARAAGLRRGDVIVSIDDEGTRSLTELQLFIASKRIGETISIRFRRGQTYHTADVELRSMRLGGRR